MIAGLVCGVVMSAHAGLVNIGSGGIKVDTKEVAKTVAKKGIEKSINDKLAKKNCAFTGATKKDPVGSINCDLNGIISELKNWHDGLEATISNDFDINIEASHETDSTTAYNRATKVQNTIKQKINYWDYNVTSVTANGDKVRIWISVN